MVNVANGTRCRYSMLPPTEATPKRQPWYGYSMRTILHSQINGAPVRRQQRPTVADECLYRYVPVPPVGRDEDGYLVEDGMSQTYQHMTQTARWQYLLEQRLPTATVCSDLAMHYDPHDDNKTLVPDLFVALQVHKRPSRRRYDLWDEPVPDLVIEMLSKSNHRNDTGRKWATYEYLGVSEYWLFDPEGFELPKPLVGYRLQDQRYRKIASDAAGRWRSEVLGLDLHVRDGQLRFRDPATGEDLRTYEEAEDRIAAAERERTTEKNRADAAENRAADAERELARLRRRLEAP